MEQRIIVTNNDQVQRKHGGSIQVILLEQGSYVDVLNQARDLIHRGAKLLSHPMAGSLKPNQTPYRSVLLIGQEQDELDMESLRLIENSIEAAEKFLQIKKPPNWPPKILEDFKTVDLSILDSAIK